MRKVLFRKWIPAIKVSKTEFHLTVIQDGTNCWETDFTREGIFHQWASAMEESNEGFGNYTVALVELPDGKVIEVLPSNLIFVSPPVL